MQCQQAVGRELIDCRASERAGAEKCAARRRTREPLSSPTHRRRVLVHAGKRLKPERARRPQCRSADWVGARARDASSLTVLRSELSRARDDCARSAAEKSKLASRPARVRDSATSRLSPASPPATGGRVPTTFRAMPSSLALRAVWRPARSLETCLSMCTPRRELARRSASTDSAVDLAFERHDPPEPSGKGSLVMLHGLFGSSQNWRSLGKALSRSTGRSVHCLVRAHVLARL